MSGGIYCHIRTILKAEEVDVCHTKAFHQQYANFIRRSDKSGVLKRLKKVTNITKSSSRQKEQCAL